MKYIIAVDKFKGCLSSIEVNESVVVGIKRANPHAETICFPVSDGGEGLVSAFRKVCPDYIDTSVHVTGPRWEMNEVLAHYIISPDGKTAVMEMSSACGLDLLTEDLRDPEKTTSYGFGEMLVDAIKRGVEHILTGIGGTATCDCGQGILHALEDNGISYSMLKQICKISVACDVQNPLFGINGAAYIFAPQKGADELAVRRLDTFLKDMYIESGCKDSVPGDGAAGGAGFCLRYFLGAELKSGIDVVLDALNFDEHIQSADLIITGEGKSDIQTLMGKLPMGILQRCRKYRKPVLLIAGSIDAHYELMREGFTDLLCINRNDHRPLKILMQPNVAKQNIENEIQSYCSRS